MRKGRPHIIGDDPTRACRRCGALLQLRAEARGLAAWPPGARVGRDCPGRPPDNVTAALVRAAKALTRTPYVSPALVRAASVDAEAVVRQALAPRRRRKGRKR